MRYLIFDSETQIHKSHKRTANPFHVDNYVVLRGWKMQGDERCSAERFEGKTKDNYLRIPDDIDVIVGHNIKFDVLYEMANNSPDLKAFFKRGGRVWCTQYAEYLLNGQRQSSQMVAMDAIIESYGGRKKVDGIKELWQAGVQTADIDKDMLLDYLIGTKEEQRNSGDIGNTELIYLGQLEAAHDLGMYQGILLRMDGLSCTTEMEFNGLKIDVAQAKLNLAELTVSLAKATKDLDAYTSEIPDEVGFNWGSNTHKSCFIFGGTIKYSKQTTYMDQSTGELARKKATEAWPMLDGKPIDPAVVAKTLTPLDKYLSGKKKGETKYKKVAVQGELKVKYQDFFYDTKGYTKPKAEWKGKLLDGMGLPTYSTGAEVIEEITKRDIPFLKALGKFTDLNKEIGTYYIKYDTKKKMYVGMLTCVQPADHIVHHSINHTSTITSRLSANNPNCQNIPKKNKSKVKGIFTSRFDDGNMVEIDYSQLEVVVQGLLTGDKQLCKDLVNKVDFHCKRVSNKFKCTYEEALYRCKTPDYEEYEKWSLRRTEIKGFSFKRAYGAGAPSISDSTGIPLEEVKELIKLEDSTYPGIGRFNTRVESEVVSDSTFFRDPARGYRPFRKGTWQAPTGTIYSWRSYDAPKWMKSKGITDTFKPTELKNYPVQGTGGEIVQMVLGVLWRWFVKTDNFNGRAFLVNTVHDCVWYDTHPDVTDEVVQGATKIMEAVPMLLKKYFDIDCPVPFPVDAERGKNMLDLHH